MGVLSQDWLQTRGEGSGDGGGDGGKNHLSPPNNEIYHHLRLITDIFRIDRILDRGPIYDIWRCYCCHLDFLLLAVHRLHEG
jgi:hypothetical protein